MPYRRSKLQGRSEMHKFRACGSKASGYIEQEDLHQISCAGQPKEIALRFQAIGNALLRGQKKPRILMPRIDLQNFAIG